MEAHPEEARMGRTTLAGQPIEEHLVRLSDVLFEPPPHGAPLVDAGMRMRLLQMREEQLMLWVAGALAGARPRRVHLPPFAKAALEGWMSWIARRPIRANPDVCAVGRAIVVKYVAPECPVVTIALPALAAPAFRDAIIEILQDDWREGYPGVLAFRGKIDKAIQAAIDAAQNRLTVEEAAFQILGLIHRLSDPSGEQWWELVAEAASRQG
jgi:hypothetical protein